MSETDYESVAKQARRESLIAGLEQGAHRDLEDMSLDEMLIELVWSVRKAGIEIGKLMQDAQKNPMLSMLFKK